MSENELKEILEKHLHWLHEDCEGWEELRADLSDTDLRGVNLDKANLCGANLKGACLRGAHLYKTELNNADLYGADLCGAELRFAELYNANLYGVNLHSANLYDADLSYASLFSANLNNAVFRRANLRYTDLRRADLFRTIIHEADLYGANLSGAKNIPFIPLVCPSARAFTGWKKGLIFDDKTLDMPFGVVIELEIPADAKRSSATTRKCRCDKALVKSITSLDGSEFFDTAYSKYDFSFAYKVGEMVSVDNFEEDRFKECAPGIHFFIDRQEAVDYPSY